MGPIDQEYLIDYITREVIRTKVHLLNNNDDNATVNITAHSLNRIFGKCTIPYTDEDSHRYGCWPSRTIIGFMCGRDMVFRWYYRNDNWCGDDIIREMKLEILTRFLLDEFNNASETHQNSI